MSNAAQITTVICVTTIATWIVWDIWVAFFNRIPNKLDTISGQTQRFASYAGILGSKSVYVPQALGVLCGHFVWCGGGTLGHLDIPLLIGLATLFGVIAHNARRVFNDVWIQVGLLQCGICLGHFFWSQECLTP